jgi:ribonucleoside-diphosphate reductase alpha chain
MFKDLLNTYKYGWKTSYYQNTYDFKGADEVEEPTSEISTPLVQVERGEFKGTDDEYEEYCDSCAI